MEGVMEDVGLKPGTIVSCKVIEPEGDGYSVVLQQGERTGLILSAPRPLSTGEVVSARFLCLRKGRALLAMRHSKGPAVNAGVSDENEEITESNRMQRLHLRRASDLIPPAFLPVRPSSSFLLAGLFRSLKSLSTTSTRVVLKPVVMNGVPAP